MASITKRTWKTRGGVEKSAWRVGFSVGTTQRYRQFDTERKAKKFLEKVSEERKRLEAKGIGYNSPSFRDVCNTWLSSRTSGSDGNPPLEKMTSVWYRGQLDNYIIPALGHLRIAEIDRKMLKDFRTMILSDTPAPDKDGKPSKVSVPAEVVLSDGVMHRPFKNGVSRSRKTAQMLMATLRQIFNYAIDNEIIRHDPSQRLIVRMGSRHRPQVVVHSVEEMTAIMKTARELTEHPNKTISKPWLRYYPMLMLSVYCGLRISEIRGLDCKDIDFSRQVIRIRQRADAKGTLGPPKSAQGFREVHYPQVLEPELRRLIGDKTEGLVFVTRSGRPVDTANFRKRCWETVQKRAGVRELTLHSARHFFASRQIANGVNPKELANVIGHADEGFTLRVYGHLFTDQETEARRKQRVETLVLV